MYRVLSSWKGLASLLIAAIGIVCAVLFICDVYLQSYSAAQLAQAPDGEVEFYLRRQLQVSNHPEQDLVHALNSNRASLALAATNVLKQKRSRWRNQAALRYQQEMIDIAVELEARWDQLAPTARLAAVSMAEDVANWNLGLEPDQTRRFNEAIDQILRRSAAATPMIEPRPLVSALAMFSPDKQKDLPLEYQPPEKVATAPGGYLPVAPVNPGVKVADKIRPPSGFPSAAALTSKPIDPQGGREPTGFAGALGMTPGLLPESARPSPPMDLKKLADIDVMHWLHDTRPEIVELAEEELLSRRFQPFELQLARRLTSPRVEERLRLAKELSVETTLDRQTWLIELAHDVDADVRIIAQKQLMQMRVSDRDASYDAPR
ncbi:hypothetical protein M4951_18260 [Blastopirellula sp. J2-11]|uniref:hypothetical protein n=1 Tax=Blastopirellula sp. J2-11 TaxID=2943192 RepID=UPI0021C58D84|nr:hypothetical protein [Blastopirellula sp. J2-11]UUO05313.1 hypothetical protein M4951_18260 [Blastopirellula sp. J2-11]